MGMMLRRHLNKPNGVEKPEKVVEVTELDTAEVENTKKAVEKKSQTK